MYKTIRLTVSSMCLALGILLPQVTHFVPEIAKHLSLMHIPTYITGILCGPLYGAAVGVLSPIFSMMLFNMPSGTSLYSMIIELACYGFFSGLIYSIFRTKNEVINIYFSLILSMIIGKIICGLCNAFIIKAGEYSISIWVGAAFIDGLLGIILHLIIVPCICLLFKTRMNYNK